MWPATDLPGVKNIHPSNWKIGETGLPLDLNAVHQNSESLPVTKKNLDRSASVSSEPSTVQSRSTPLQQTEEQVSINLSNLGPAASPGSSPGSSNVSSPGIGSMKSSHPIGTDSLSSVFLLDKSKGERSDRNHVVDIPPALSDLATDSHTETPNFPGASDRTEERITRSQDSGTRFLHDVSNGPSTIARIVDQAFIEDPRALHERVDPSVKADSRSEPETPHVVNNKTDSSLGITSAPASISSGSHPLPEARPSTRNYTAKKPPASRLGPSNALAGIRILLAEDTPVLAKVATIMLQKMGARVVAVADGLQAVETIGRSRGDQSFVDSEASTTPLAVDQFDLVLMDCQVRSPNIVFNPVIRHVFNCFLAAFQLICVRLCIIISSPGFLIVLSFVTPKSHFSYCAVCLVFFAVRSVLVFELSLEAT